MSSYFAFIFEKTAMLDKEFLTDCLFFEHFEYVIPLPLAAIASDENLSY